MAIGIKKLIASALIGSLIILPGVLLAQERRGAMVVVTRKTGGQVAGELIVVKQDSLLLLSPVGKDESVDIPDIWTIEIVRKHKAGSGFLIGFLAGGIAGGVLGSQWNKGDSSYKGAAILPGALLFGALSGLVGLGIGAATGADKMIELGKMPNPDVNKALAGLRMKARMRG
jgi:hypothetical protein